MSEDFYQNTQPEESQPQGSSDYGQPSGNTGYSYGQPQQGNTGYGYGQPQQGNTGYDYGQPQQGSTGYSYGQPSGNTYAQRQYSQQIYPQTQPMRSESTGFGIASLVLGILSVLLFCTCINYLLALLAIIFGIIQIAKSEHRGLAIAGIITACISIILGILMWIGMFSFAEGFTDYFEGNSFYMENYDTHGRHINEL